jgi:predicted ArsR family transcriptional regulator
MPSKHELVIYQILSESPVTPNEVAQKLGITQKTAQQTLMQLALTHPNIKYKLSGRIHLFWKK